MGLLSPSFSMALYRARVDDPDGFLARAVEALGRHVFNPDVAGVTEVARGWTRAHRPFPPAISYEEVVFGHRLHFAMVVERRRVPAQLVKKHLALEEARVLEESGRRRLSAKQRKELRERVKLALLAKTLPVPAVHDCAWNLATGQLFLFSTQQKVMELFEELFFSTFSIRPLPVTAGSLALDLAQGRGMEAELDGVAPEALI